VIMLLLLLLGRHRFSHGFNPWSCLTHSPTWGSKPSHHHDSTPYGTLHTCVTTVSS
jgi:hypothetical protein